MNVARIEEHVKRFIARHRTTLSQLSGRQSQLLELAATVGVSEHYRAAGYEVDVVNPKGSQTFTVKSGTRGHPSKYSWIRCTKGTEEVEIHMNTLVRSAHDEGIYCVDVAVVRAGRMPRSAKPSSWECLPNDDLISFAEAKRLAIYPMLLAQFIGIVHEILPRFLGDGLPPGFGPRGNLPPTLIALGHFSGNSLAIRKSFERRGFAVLIAESYDIRLAITRRGTAARSPFYSDTFEDAAARPRARAAHRARQQAGS